MYESIRLLREAAFRRCWKSDDRRVFEQQTVHLALGVHSVPSWLATQLRSGSAGEYVDMAKNRLQPFQTQP
jgi:hypothetical protein